MAATLERMVPPGMEPIRLFRTIARHPELLDRFRTAGTTLLSHGTVAPRDREIVLHRTCARCGARYEWGVHAALFAEAAGLSAEQVAATWHGDADDPAWTEGDRALVRLADELHDSGTIGDALWDELARRYEPHQLLELVAVAGFYHLASFLANAFHVEPEEWSVNP